MDVQKAKIICNEMLVESRGYILMDKDKNIYAKHGKDFIMVFYIDNEKLNIKHTKDFIATSMENDISHMIIVYQTITSSAKKLLYDIHHIQTEFFSIQELQFNITKHEYVPKHEKLSDEDATRFIKKFGYKLPVILDTDPIARHYHFKQDDIIKLYRKNNEISYRICKRHFIK